jgi:hypothetical protein
MEIVAGGAERGDDDAVTNGATTEFIGLSAAELDRRA